MPSCTACCDCARPRTSNVDTGTLIKAKIFTETIMLNKPTDRLSCWGSVWGISKQNVHRPNQQCIVRSRAEYTTGLSCIDCKPQYHMQVEFVGTRLTPYCRQHSNTIKQSCISHECRTIKAKVKLLTCRHLSLCTLQSQGDHKRDR